MIFLALLIGALAYLAVMALIGIVQGVYVGVREAFAYRRRCCTGCGRVKAYGRHSVWCPKAPLR